MTAVDNSLIFLCLLAILVSCLICVRYLQLMRILRWRPPERNRLSSTVRLSVIIPARNEEEDLAACLTSILQQADVDLQVVIVNDHSTDRTGEIANSIATSDSRVRVLHDPELRPGWLGKVNAMQHALECTTHDLVLFTDADVIHAPGCFALVLAIMEQQQLDFVSLFPRLHCVSLIENVNAPAYIGGFCQIVGESVREGSGRGMGAGALMLVRRPVLEAIGGLAAIKTEMLDDVMLATLVKRHGFALGFWAGSNLVDVRFYKGNWPAFWGMTKNVLAELRQRFWIAPIAALVPFLVFWTPWISMLWGAATANWLLFAVGAGTYLIQYLLLLPCHEIVPFHRGKVLFFPLVSIVILCNCVRASYHYFIRGAVYWRGRSIRVREA